METFQDEETKIKVVSWPSPQDYNEAVQNLEHSMIDVELKESQAELNALGLPKPSTGSFATVYKLTGKSQEWALRCFLHNRADQHERYKLISEHLESVETIANLVPFRYLDSGMNVHGRLVPVMKMNWVNGSQLVQYVEDNLHSVERLVLLRDRFARCMQELGLSGIAHGDLQHGNILVLDDGLKLVDYDGMYISSLDHLGSAELGHRNYQHPKRSASDFGPWLDNFPAWVIYCSLTCLIHDPELWNQINSGEESLLFRREDFVEPLKSRTFQELENHQTKKIRTAAKFLRSLLDLELEKIPYLQLIDGNIPEISNTAPAEAAAPAAPSVSQIDSAPAKPYSAPAFVPPPNTVSANATQIVSSSSRGKVWSMLVWAVVIIIGGTVIGSFVLSIVDQLKVSAKQSQASVIEIFNVIASTSGDVKDIGVASFDFDLAIARLGSNKWDSQCVNQIGSASIALLRSGALSDLSTFNSKLSEFINVAQSKNADPADIKKLRTIFDANAKAIDSMLRSSL